MFDVVRVSDKRLIGEIIEIMGEMCYIQVYEETGGIGVGEPVYTTGAPLCVELGPGLVSSIYDGIQRPLDKIREKAGDFIFRGIDIFKPFPIRYLENELSGGIGIVIDDVVAGIYSNLVIRFFLLLN